LPERQRERSAKLEARAGETLVVDPGTGHKWWNAGEDELVFRCEIRPAGQ
jgi:oxalate decarboxylase/phosphoglucose isomerase-like protein (cupin superfamily)